MVCTYTMMVSKLFYCFLSLRTLRKLQWMKPSLLICHHGNYYSAVMYMYSSPSFLLSLSSSASSLTHEHRLHWCEPGPVPTVWGTDRQWHVQPVGDRMFWLLRLGFDSNLPLRHFPGNAGLFCDTHQDVPVAVFWCRLVTWTRACGYDSLPQNLSSWSGILIFNVFCPENR